MTTLRQTIQDAFNNAEYAVVVKEHAGVIRVFSADPKQPVLPMLAFLVSLFPTLSIRQHGAAISIRQGPKRKP